ncbi:MAG TPA: hypothetical protein VLQ67_00690 [Arachnia sp.]|nr:hypothetical protein [Arachnia sp.]
MWIAIVGAAIVTLGLAAFAGLGRLGEMPADAVNDRPRGRVPAGPVTPELLAAAILPTAWSGYRRDQVDRYLAELADGTAAPEAEVVFDVVRRGYDMQVIDELLLRGAYERPTAAESSPEQPAQEG